MRNASQVWWWCMLCSSSCVEVSDSHGWVSMAVTLVALCVRLSMLSVLMCGREMITIIVEDPQ